MVKIVSLEAQTVKKKANIKSISRGMDHILGK